MQLGLAQRALKRMSTNGVSRSHSRGAVSAIAGLALLLAALFVGFAPAGATSSVSSAKVAPSAGDITIAQTDGAPSLFCLPGWMVLTRDIVNTPGYFELVIHANFKPCAPINATAAIYGMPGNGVAWPQTLKATKNFTITNAGMTRVRFAKTCDQVQFDVLTGATPEVISPTGPWHGPLLFPLDMETSYQHWGCGGSTTSTSSGNACENYAARQLGVSPVSVAPGAAVTVSGLGTPHTTQLVWITQPAGSTPEVVIAPVSVVVPASGQFSAQFTLPANAPTGSWTANAQASDCQAVISVDFSVVSGTGGGENPGGTSTPPGSSVAPGVSTPPGAGGATGTGSGSGSGNALSSGVEVAGINATQKLPSGAVESASLSKSDSGSVRSTQAAGKLAWTGSNVRVPLVLGATLLMVGALLVLRNRRSATA